jgi:uncharacterized protein YidB (DUF937 family)
MGLLDQLGGSLKGVLGSVAAAEAPGLITAALAKTNMGNLQGLVDQLQQGGLANQVNSWLGNGANIQVTPEQIQSALGNDQLKQLAQRFGVDTDAVAKLLAEHLPTVVDQASPNGSIQNS